MNCGAVLKPGGLVLHSTHTRDPQSANVILRDKWRQLVEARGEQWRRPGAQGREAIAAEFQSLGASLEEIPVVRQTDATTPQQEIAGIAHRIHSDTWAVSEPVLQATVAELTDWARDHFGALDVSLPEENTFTWQVYRFDRRPTPAGADPRGADSAHSDLERDWSALGLGRKLLPGFAWREGGAARH